MDGVGLFLLGAILLFIFLAFIYATLGLVTKEVLRWGSSSSIDQFAAKIVYFFVFATKLGNESRRWSGSRG